MHITLRVNALVLFSLFLSSSFAEAKTNGVKTHPRSVVQNNKHAQLPVLNKWFALGSGCQKSTPEQQTDVSMSPIASDRSNVDRVNFKLSKYHLAFPNPNKVTATSVASECAIRINVNPPPDKKIKSVSLKTALVSTKEKDVELTTYVGLKIGTSPIGSALSKYETGNEFSNRQEDVMLIPGSKPEEVFPDLKCGEPKIIGIDFTFLAKSAPVPLRASVALAGDKMAELIVDLEDCK